MQQKRTPRVIVQPVVEPISLDEARLHLRLDTYDSPAMHPDDPIVTALITAAREYAEQWTGRTIAAATLELALDAFVAWPQQPGVIGYVPACASCGSSATWSQGAILLPGPPVIGVNSITYVDGAGVQQFLTGYQLDLFSDPPRLLPLAGASWPSVATQELNAVRIRYAAGYSLPGDSPNPYPLPMSLRAAILLLVGHLYENRENTTVDALKEIPFGVESLLRQHRVQDGFA